MARQLSDLDKAMARDSNLREYINELRRPLTFSAIL